LGLKATELRGRCIFDLTHPGDVVADRAQYRRQVAGEIDGYRLEKRFLRADGSFLWASVSSRSVKEADGRFAYAIRVQQDISERKSAEGNLIRHSEEQGALHQLIARLQHASRAENIYEAAMDAMQRALRCDRVSVLLFDPAGVMRFVAARGLSEAYRKSVEGHSPWSRDTKSPQPVCIADVAASDLPDDLKATVTGEGIAALAFVPLEDAERLAGKFMIYYDAPHAFTSAQVELAQTIARHVGLSLERLQAQRAALHLAALVESSEDAIVSKDLSGIIQSWNRGAERLFGYTPAEAIGQPVTLLIPFDRLDEEPKIIARIRRGERVEHFDTIRRRKDGSLVDISLTISPIKDMSGTIVGASKIARDITARKATDRKLRDNERQLQDLLSAIPAAIYTTDAAGRITYYNQAAVEFAGREPKLGTDEWCVSWKLYWPDGTPLPHHECPMAIALKEGRAIRGVEAVAERPDGTRVPFIPYPTPLRDADGNLVGAINMLVDISQRKEAETQQRILLNELNHRVKNNMQMLNSLLSASARQTKSPEARQTLEEATGRLAAMAAAQRTLYGNNGALRFNAHDFLQSVCATSRQAFPRNVAISCEAEPVELSNDVAMPLALILNELLTNAVKHGIKERGGRIRVNLARLENRFTLSVEDDGPGFDMNDIQGQSSGLFLIRGLVRQLGGTFHVTKNPTCCVIEFGREMQS
jgi:PAS domain S-box-containing protein